MLGLGLVLWSLAYAMPYTASLHIGGDKRTSLREYDAPFLIDFNASQPDDKQEPPWSQRSEPAYRWAEDRAAIKLPGIGSGAWLLSLQLSGQPGKDSVISRWTIGDQPAFEIAISSAQRRYHILTSTASGDLTLGFETPRLEGPGDPSKRNLALAFSLLQAQPMRSGMILPAPMSLALLAATLILLYGIVYRLGSGGGQTRRQQTRDSRHETADSGPGAEEIARGEEGKMTQYLASQPQHIASQPPQDVASLRSSSFMLQPSSFCLLLILITSTLLVTDRLGLTIWLPGGAMLTAICYLLIILGEPFLTHLSHLVQPQYLAAPPQAIAAPGQDLAAPGAALQRDRATPQPASSPPLPLSSSPTPPEYSLALGTVIIGFAIRMVALLHPYALDSDLGFHVNNLKRLAWGQVFQTAGLPCEAGAGIAPYPPAQSITLLPGLLFGTDDAWLRLWLRGANALLESMGAALLWLILRRAGLGPRLALLGAALYTVAPPLLRAYSIGEMANIFGQIWLPILLLCLTRGQGSGVRDQETRHRTGDTGQETEGIRAEETQTLCTDPKSCLSTLILQPSAFIFLLMLLSHTGVTISTIAFLSVWWLLGLGRTYWRRQLLRATGWLAAATIAFVCFYSAYAYLPEQNRASAAERIANNPAAICPPERPLTTKIWDTLSLGAGPQGSLTTPLLLAAIAGTLLSTNRSLRRILIAAWLGTLLSFATLLTSAQPVRWAHFLFPMLCIAAAVGLGHVLQHGRAGRLVGWTLFVSMLYYGLERWITQIATYLH